MKNMRKPKRFLWVNSFLNLKNLTNSIQIIVLILQFNYSNLEEICRCGQQNAFRLKRIVGGTVLTENKYPWIVAILDTHHNNKLICGGTIVTQQHVLTAGHCVFKRKPNEIAVKIGSVRLNASNNIHLISEIKCHSKYSEELQDYDIAILTLKNALNYTSNRPICLPQFFNTNKSDKARIAGWGKTGFCELLNIFLISHQFISLNRKLLKSTKQMLSNYYIIELQIFKLYEHIILTRITIYIL